MNSQRIEEIVECIRSGPPDELQSSCEDIIRLWKTAPVEELLALKEQFRKLGMERREACLEEALISVAEKRPVPFTTIVTDPGHPSWGSALEVLAMLDDPGYLDLFVSLAPLVDIKKRRELVKAIGCFRCEKAVSALSGLLKTSDEELMMEVVLALKRCGPAKATAPLRDALENSAFRESGMAPVLEAVLKDMERGKMRG